MGGSNNQSGVDPGQTQNGTEQNNQPDNENQTDAQGNTDDILQAFYQLPDTVRLAISALPEDQRNLAVQALDTHRKELEGGMTERLERGRQAEDNLQALWADPNIQKYINTGEMGNTGQAERQPVGALDQQRYVDKYGQEAADFMGDIKTSISEGLGLDELTRTVQELGTMVRADRQNSAWDDLKARVQTEGLPDPEGHKSTIAGLLRNNNNLTVDQAYMAALGVSGIPVRPAAASLQSQASAGDQAAAEAARKAALSTESPGANRGSLSTRYEIEEGDPVEQALKARKEGKVRSLAANIREGMKKVVQQINERDGTNLNLDDL